MGGGDRQIPQLYSVCFQCNVMYFKVANLYMFARGQTQLVQADLEYMCIGLLCRYTFGKVICMHITKKL